MHWSSPASRPADPRPSPRMRPKVVLAALALVAVTACQAPSWSQLRFDAGQTGANLGETTLTASSFAAALPLDFRVPVGNSTDVVSNGRQLFGNVRAGVGAMLFAADANGSLYCAGSPKTCQLLWRAPLRGTVAWTAATATTAFAIDGPSDGSNQVLAFDANGVTNCSGTPNVCQPLWSTTDTDAQTATISGDRLYVIDRGAGLEVYDATGTQNCSGTPKRCSPLWTAAFQTVNVAPAVNGGHVTVVTWSGTSTYDAAGTDHCNGTPVVCTPQWTARLVPGAPTLATAPLSVAATNGQIVTVRPSPSSGPAILQVTDARGAIGCSGSPVACTPLWSASLFGSAAGRPAVGNGRIVVVTQNGGFSRAVQSFDLPGASATCAPSAYGVVCTAQWTNADTYSISADDASIVSDFVLTGFTIVDPNTETAKYGGQVLSLANGQTKWVDPANNRRPLMVSNGHLFLSAQHGLQVLG